MNPLFCLWVAVAATSAAAAAAKTTFSTTDKTSAAWLSTPTTSFGAARKAVASRYDRSFRSSLFLATTTTTTSTAPSSSSNSIIAINPLINGIKPSKTVEIFSQVKQLQAEGIAVTSLCVGEPDFLPPPAVLQAIAQAAANGQTQYTAVTGTAALRQAIAKDLLQRKSVSYNPLNEIVVGNGAKQCVYQAVLALAGAGNAVLIPAPYWPSYPEMALLAGAEPVIVQTKADTGYLMTAPELHQALEQHPNIKALILCNPSNPTGGVYSKEHLLELTAVLDEFPHVAVIADEIYERLVYTGQDCTCFASLPGQFYRTITINGFSKSHAMTGLRLGYLAAPVHLARAVTTIQSQLTSCASSISQAAGVAALTQVSEEEMQHNVNIMKEKRNFVLRHLADMPHVRVHVPPDGAFYVLPDISYYCDEEPTAAAGSAVAVADDELLFDDTALCLDLLQQEKLAVVPGSSFGAPGTIRISYATSMEELDVAMSKLRNYLQNLLEHPKRRSKNL